jgi:hypothetical protein|tara:strand:- start:463 stop:1005 length:543 start_codon:yes stop_codon:yes gene_type:complete
MNYKVNKSEEFLKTVLTKSTGFTAPKNYFSDAEDRFSSFLLEDQLPQENGFTFPENYFEDLENDILNKVSLKKEARVISLKSKLLKYIPLTTAASVALFLSINYLNPFATEEISFDTLGKTDIENWIIENSNELSNEDFATLLQSKISNENNFALTDIRNDEIEEYIIYSEESSVLNENY